MTFLNSDTSFRRFTSILLLNEIYQLPSVLPTIVEFSVIMNPNLVDDAGKLICVNTYYVLVWLQALYVLTSEIRTVTFSDRSKFLEVWSLDQHHHHYLAVCWKCAFWGLTSIVLNEKLWGGDLAVCVLMRSPGNSDICWSLTTTDIGYCIYPHFGDKLTELNLSHLPNVI